MDGDDLPPVPDDPIEPDPGHPGRGVGLGDDDGIVPGLGGGLDHDEPGPGPIIDLEPDPVGPGPGDEAETVGRPIVPGAPTTGGDAGRVELPSFETDDDGGRAIDSGTESTIDAGPGISLDTDAPLVADASQAGQDGGAGVDLGTDPDGSVDPDGLDPLAADGPVDEGGIALPLDDGSPLAPYVVAEGNGMLDDLVVAAGLSAIGAAAAIPVVRRVARAAPQDTVALLDSLGIDARVEHGDVVELEERLAAGGSVLLASDGSAGVDTDRVLHLDVVDREAGAVRLRDHRGRRRVVDLERFEAVWADSANQLIVAAGEGRSVVLLPLVLDDADLASTR
jgi:hypothetical protein